MAKKTDIINETFFTFPPVNSKLITLAEADSNHYPEAGEDLLVWMPEYRALDYTGHGEKWIQQHGTKARNIDPSMYSKNADRYRPSFEFRSWSICTESMIVGNNHTTSEAGRAYLDSLYEAEAIKKIGKIENSGSYNEYKIFPAGIDLLFGVQNLADSLTVRPLNDNCEPVEIPAGALFLATGSLGLSRSSKNSVNAGTLIPEACLNGGAESLLFQGRIVKAGSLENQFSDITLLPNVAEYFRALAVTAADCRMRDGKQTDEQEEYMARLFNEVTGVSA